MSSGTTKAGFNWSMETLSILLFISVIKFLSSRCITLYGPSKGDCKGFLAASWRKNTYGDDASLRKMKSFFMPCLAIGCDLIFSIRSFNWIAYFEFAY